MIPLLKEIEKPHQLFHESAIQIQKTYSKADTSLPEFIARKEIDHLNWTAAVQTAILTNKKAIDVQTDHTQCGFGKWYEEVGRMLADLLTHDQLGDEVYTYYRDVVKVAGQEVLEAVAFSHTEPMVRWKAASILLEWGVRPEPKQWLPLVQWLIQNDEAERAYELAERMDQMNP